MTFNVQSDWPVLVLEDMPERVAWFKERLPRAVYVTTADAAIEALKSQEFRALAVQSPNRPLQSCQESKCPIGH
jgi:hypothetical protein